ncbi:hypothetical protein KQX54_007363 [Cotesia glomerata]|uniref:Uncharacterized protein n=1 Tax=Cotesia glomerata TaxID=32391 RepID=A0AAV7IKJ2_COTGL|nr:hypothetical protein KQX54_007363 [Cotesia glomerata]
MRASDKEEHIRLDSRNLESIASLLERLRSYLRFSLKSVGSRMWLRTIEDYGEKNENSSGSYAIAKRRLVTCHALARGTPDKNRIRYRLSREECGNGSQENYYVMHELSDTDMHQLLASIRSQVVFNIAKSIYLARLWL